MLNYYCPVYDGDVIYSCDMLRLSFYLPLDIDLREFKSCDIDRFYWLAEQYGFLCDVFGPSFAVSSYRWLLTFSSGSCVIKLGIQHNSFRSDNRTVLCSLEFNPNKCNFGFLGEVYFYCYSYGNKFKSVSSFFSLSRFDLAVDVPVAREFVRLIKSGKRAYSYSIRDGAITEYSGVRSSHGFTKVYDKTKESALDYYLTRIEITCTDFSVALPDVHISYSGELLLVDELTGTDLILVEFFNRLDDVEFNSWFRMLPRKKKEKLSRFLRSGKDSFEFSKTAIIQVFENVKDIMAGEFMNKETFFKNGKRCSVASVDNAATFAFVDNAPVGGGFFEASGDLPFCSGGDD